MTRLVRLYPAAWRERYEVELRALLDGTPLFGLIGTSRLGPAYLLVGVGALLALGFNTEDGRALWLIPLGAAWVIVGTMMVRGAPAVSRRLAGQVVVVETSPRTPRAAD